MGFKKMPSNEMNLIYKFYGHFTAKENYVFSQLIFHSSMVYNKVNWYFLTHKFSRKLQPKIVRALANNDPDGMFFNQQENGKIVDALLDDWKAFFESHDSWKRDKSKFNGKPKRPRCKKVKDKMNEVVFDARTIRRLDVVKKGKLSEDGRGVITDNKISFALSNTARTKLNIKTNDLEVNLSNFKFPKGLNEDLSNLQQVRICYDERRKAHYLAFIYRVKMKSSKEDNNEIMAIDLGQNNLATIVFNDSKDRFIIDGKELKSKIAYVNSRIDRLQSKEMRKTKDSTKFKTTKRIKKLYNYWFNYKMTYIHKASSKIIGLALSHNCKTIVMGDFKGVKYKKRNMKYFVTMPHLIFIEAIKYKAKLVGIDIIIQNESYTSGCSCIDDYEISKECYNKKRRKKRGDFVTNNGFHINADVNGAYNILRKYLKEQLNQKNNIPQCLIEDTYKNLYLTYLNMYLGFKGNAALASGVNKILYSPILIHFDKKKK